MVILGLVEVPPEAADDLDHDWWFQARARVRGRAPRARDRRGPAQTATEKPPSRKRRRKR